jgi:putative heme utilization carrier protein HutX
MHLKAPTGVSHAAHQELVRRLTENPDGILERIAEEAGVSTFDVVQALPAEHRTILAGNRMLPVMESLTTWGDVLVVVHTRDLVLECKGPIPSGSLARGYFNIHGAGPISGHIKSDHCSHVVFVSRPFMGRPSRSIQFFNQDGEAMFKVFVRRDEKREMIADQVAMFDALRGSYAEQI